VKVRNVSTQAVVVPVDGGIAVAVDAVVDVPDDIGQVLVSDGPFEAVTATDKRAARSVASLHDVVASQVLFLSLVSLANGRSLVVVPASDQPAAHLRR
jgi:hypothetical protein